MSADLCELGFLEAADALANRETTSAELTAALLARSEQLEPALNALTWRDAEAVKAAATAADEARAAGDERPLLGVPIAIKDLLNVQGQPCTAGSNILKGYTAPYDATVIARLRAAGCVFVSRTNTDEFAMGGSTETSAYGTTRNPWDPERVPGGSSGGSAAAVAAEMTPFALGEDTGGSIRMPAGFCGVTGLKPTYGRVSRYGLIALVSSFDSIGPLTRDVADAALVMQTIAGHDPHDSTSLRAPVPDYAQTFTRDLKGVTVGVPVEYFAEGIDPAVEAPVREAVTVLRDLGVEVREISLPHTPYAIPVYYLILFAEASSNLARFDGVRFGLSSDGADVLERYLHTRAAGFGDEVKRRIMLGTFALSAGYYDAYYLRAQKVRALLRQDFDRAFAEVDALVAPVCPTPAFKLGEKVAEPLTMYLSDVHVVAINPAGVPSLALPCGFTGDAPPLPVGMQLIGRPLDEATLFRIGHAYQQATSWHLARPTLAS